MKHKNFIILALLLLASEAWVQARKPTSIAELASYRGTDREQVSLWWGQDRRQNSLVHVSGRRLVQGNGQSVRSQVFGCQGRVVSSPWSRSSCSARGRSQGEA